MIRRTAERHLRHLARRHPVVTVMGPRQSGKTTLCRAVFRGKPYVSLEALDTREHARSDPRGFLAEYRDGAVIDEVQRVPGLLSYLQQEIDERPTPGRFVLTGSQNMNLLASVSQSLAGRAALLPLLPLGLEEIRRFPSPPQGLFDVVWAGGYPAIHERRVPAGEWLVDYITTYVERDVRQILDVGNLGTFQRFLGLCAGRSGQLVSGNALGADAGISHNTARAWLSVLEASFVTHTLPPFSRNVRKRSVRTPKLYFVDSGLLCALLGIRTPKQLRDHPLRGAIFETWVVSEVMKARVHRGLPPALSFYRDRQGAEVDLLIDGARLTAMEIKSGQTIASDFFAGFERVVPHLGEERVDRVVVYGGRPGQRRGEATVVSWSDLEGHAWTRS